MQSYIGTGYPVMLFNMASSRGTGSSWYSALHHHASGVVDPRPLLPAQVEVARRPTRHFIADILDLRDDDNDDDDEMRCSRMTSNLVPVKHVDVSGSGSGAVWTSMSPSPPSLSSNADDVTTSPDSEPPQRCAEDLRLTTRLQSTSGSESCTSHTPPSSDVDVDYMSDHGIVTSILLQTQCIVVVITII